MCLFIVISLNTSSIASSPDDVTMESFLSDNNQTITEEHFNLVTTQKAQLINEDTGETVSVNLYEKKDNKTKLKSKSLSGDVMSKEYAIVVNEENITPNNVSTLSSGSQSNSKWHDSYGVKGWIRMNYKTKQDPNTGTIDQYLLTSVEGNWRLTDNRLILSGQRVRYRCNGLNVRNQEKDHSVSWPFNVSTGFTKYVDAGDPFSHVAARSYTQIKRLNSNGTWGLVVPVAIIGTI